MIIKLESDIQDQVSEIINELYTRAIENKSVYARNVLKRCYGDSWDTIKERMEVEGSCWYVWYMDGVNEYIRLHFKNKQPVV